MRLDGLKAYYYASDLIQKDDIIWGLLELGIDVVRPKCQIALNNYTEEQYLELEKTLEPVDFVMTQNFSLEVAEACYRKGLRYISWVYDSPQISTYRKEAFYPTNFIFTFDRAQAERLKAIGLQHVYYQPLAANIAKTSILNITDEEIAAYASDISFVGQLYKREYYRRFLNSMTTESREKYLTMLENLSCDWGKGKNIFEKADDVDEVLRQEILKIILKPECALEHEYIAWVMTVAPALAHRERVEVLKRCGQKFQTRLYTDDQVEPGELPGVTVCPKVYFDTDMYKVFFSSRINLNLTLRSIETGVPQRVFDIMSVGGFAMSNYQEEMEELFVPDKEIVLFHNMDEMMDRAAYYLSHETERVRIAMAGYDRVRREYNYPESLKKMLAIALQ